MTGCKKLPCNHIFHTSCLRSWFQRQQTCPTCRMDVLRPQPPPQPHQPPPPQGPQAPFGFPPMGVPPPMGIPPAPGVGPQGPPNGKKLFKTFFVTVMTLSCFIKHPSHKESFFPTVYSLTDGLLEYHARIVLLNVSCTVKRIINCVV